MSRRERPGFVAACVLLFALLAAWVLSSPSLSPFGRSHAPVTLAAGATRPG